MHFIDERSHHFRLRLLRDSVSQIEHVSARADRAEVVDHSARFGPDGSFSGKERHGIHVALKRNPVGNRLPRSPKTHRPVQSDAVRAAPGNILDPDSAALGIV